MEINENEMKLCNICGGDKARMGYGVLCCNPCQVFFRRNAQINLDSKQCVFDGNCQITIYNRNTCQLCRLKKCFSIGMEKDFIRASRSYQKNKTLENISKDKIFSPVIIHTLDLFRNDRSLLTTEQWSYISNIIYSYDERSPVADIEKTIASQSVYPSKIRLKIADEYYKSFINTSPYQFIQQLIKSIPEFRTMTPLDQSILIQRNIRCLGWIARLAIGRVTQLYENPYYLNVAISIYGTKMMHVVIQSINRLDNNITLFKLLMPILLFSTSSDIINLTNNETTISDGNRPLSNPLYLLKIQNFFVEIVFKYMLYQYGYYQSALRFSNILKICLDHNIWASNHDELEHHNQMVDTITKQIVESFISDELLIE